MADLTTVLQIVNSATSALLGNDVTPNPGSAASGSGGSAVSDHEGHGVSKNPSSDDVMAEMLDMAKRLHWGASVVIGPVFVVLGLIGNLLSIIVWSQRSMRSSTGRYLTALAVADSGVLIWFFLCDSLQMIVPEVQNSIGYALFFSYLGYPILFLCVVCSIWFLVGVTVDRFIMVCVFTKAKDYCNEKRANLGIFLILGTCFLINLPHFWAFSIDFERGENGTGPALIKTEYQKGEGAMRYEFWVHCIFLVLVPWFTVLTLNITIITKINKTNRKMNAKKTQESADKCRRAENQITRLLLVVTFSFLVMIGFQCIAQCFFMLMPDGFDHRIIDESYAFAKLGVVVNSSVNFIFYCLSGRRFRTEILIVLGCRPRARAYSSHFDRSSGTATSGTGTTGI